MKMRLFIFLFLASLGIAINCETPQNKSVVTTNTNSGDGGVKIEVLNFEYGAGSKIYNSQTINGGGSNKGGEDEKFLFGVTFSPYTGISNNEKDVSLPKPYTILVPMLKVIMKRFNSIMTNSMGVPDSTYNGPWNKARIEYLISNTAAQANRNNNSLVMQVLQGARLFKSSSKQPDIENAFIGAESANKIYPETVPRISLNVDNEWGYVQNLDEIKDLLRALNQQGYKRRAIEANLQIGTKMDICSEIVDGKDKTLIIELASVCNFLVCSIYPQFGTEKPEDGVNFVSNIYQRYSEAFEKVNSNLDVIVVTGWASEGDSDFNYREPNTPKNQQKFWDGMKEWALKSKVKVFMHEAFDQPKTTNEHYRNMGLWKLSKEGSNKYMDKISNKTVTV